jgi:alcohol dehydrogenase
MSTDIPSLQPPQTRHTAVVGSAFLRVPPTVAFGPGVARRAGEVASQFGRKVLVCSDRTVSEFVPAYDAVLDNLDRTGAETRVCLDAMPDVPIGSVIECFATLGHDPVEVIVAIGGGSVIDTAKLLALLLSHSGTLADYYGENEVPGPCLPVVAVPTTAGTGSEVSPVAVLTDPHDRVKIGIASSHLVPRAALCDPETTLSCPPTVTAYSGMDALVHALEAYLCPPRPDAWEAYPGEVFKGKNPLSDMFAASAVQALCPGLEQVLREPTNLGARTAVLFGSMCAGVAFSHAGTAGAHALQYPIGTLTGTPHGLGVAILAPYVLDYVKDHATVQLAELASMLGAPACSESDAATWMVDEVARIGKLLGIPTTLAAIGVRADDARRIAQDASKIVRLTKNSPRPLDVDDLETIVIRALRGA